MQKSWSLWRALGISLGLVFVFFASQLLGFGLSRILTTDFALQVGIATLSSSILMLCLSHTIAQILTQNQAKQLLGLSGFQYPWAWRFLVGLVVFWVIGYTVEVYYQRTFDAFLQPLFTPKTAGLFVFLVVVAAPIYEEVLFRGLIMGIIMRAHSRHKPKTLLIIAILINSLLFALVHIQYDLVGIFLIFVLALLLSIARAISGSVILPIMLHALNNALALVVFWIRH